jgi:hypothetical protein
LGPISQKFDTYQTGIFFVIDFVFYLGQVHEKLGGNSRR